MDHDPYRVLEIEPQATDQEIEATWKRKRNRFQLASERGDKDAERVLQQINAAHLEIVTARRLAREAPPETPASAPAPPPPPPPPPRPRPPPQDRARRVNNSAGIVVTNIVVGPEPPPWQDPLGQRWRDISADVTVPWQLAFRGGTCVVAVDAGEHGFRAVELIVPAGCHAHQQRWTTLDGGVRGGNLTLRLVSVTPHPHFRLDPQGNVHMSMRVSYADVYAGSHVRIPGPWEEIDINLPAGHRDTIRIAGHGRRGGVRQGDLIVGLEVVFPRPGDTTLEAALRSCQSQFKPEILPTR